MVGSLEGSSQVAGNRGRSLNDWTGMRTRPASVVLTAVLLAACSSDPDPAPAAEQAGSAGAHSAHGDDAGPPGPAGTAPAVAAGSGPDAASGAGDGHDHAHLDIAESGVGQLLQGSDGFGQRLREAPVQARPSAALRVAADPAGGWTVQLVTTGFAWAPQDVNSPAAAGQGHAHLYAADRKVSRVYADWTFLGADSAQEGEVMTAVLYADDHTAWAVDGQPVTASVVLPAATAQDPT